MKVFKLYLDESGDFEKDHQLKAEYRPSLVGGLLFEQQAISKQDAIQILFEQNKQTNFHSIDESGNNIINVLKRLKDYDIQKVVYENKERLLVIDSTTTYLNILAEGLVRTMLRLSVKEGKVKFKIIIATRKDVTKGHGIIHVEEYHKRLKERIIIGLARNELTSKLLPDFELIFEKAEHNYYLMLADVICNSYLTQTARKKFTPEQRAFLKDFYEDAIVTSLVKGFRQEVQTLIMKNKISDAILTTLFESMQRIKKRTQY